MPIQSNALTTTSSSFAALGEPIGGTAGYIGDITTSTGIGDLLSTITIPDYTITSTPYISNLGWVSGTTSVGTIASYPKDGTLRMDPDTNEFSIYLAESNEWVSCEVEEIRKEKDENGKVKNIITVSFGCSVAQMKKREREKIVMFEKVKKYDLTNLWGSTTTGSFAGYHTILQNPITYIGGTNVVSPITISTGGFTTITSPGQIYYDTNNYTTNITINNVGTSIQIS